MSDNMPSPSPSEADREAVVPVFVPVDLATAIQLNDWLSCPNGPGDGYSRSPECVR